MYKIKYRRVNQIFWRTIRGAVAHKVDDAYDKLIIYFKDASIREVCHWKDIEVFLGKDWVRAVKESMDKEAGQSVQTNIPGLK